MMSSLKTHTLQTLGARIRVGARIALLAGVACVRDNVNGAETHQDTSLRDSVGLISGIESRPLAEPEATPYVSTLFEELPFSRTGIDFQLKLPDMAQHIQEMIHLSVYGGICAGDYDGDDLADIYVTSPVGGNRLFRNLGDFRFADVTVPAGVNDTNFWGTGATFVDIDNDGDLDIYACGYRVANRLYLNEGAGADGRVRFSEQAAKFALDFVGASMMMAFADMDNDGDLDGYLVTTAVPPPPGAKFRVEYANQKPVIPKELQEYWAIVYLPNGKIHPTEAGQFDRLYRNDGGRFTEVTRQAGIDGAYFTLGAIWWDYNSDGHPDLYVANDYLGPDILYRNNGNGTFTDVIREVIPHTPWSSMGMDVADLNNDGLMDLLATDMLGSTHYRRQVMQGEATQTDWFLEVAEPRQYRRNALYLNTGTERMMEAAYQTGLAATDWTWGPRMEDFDNDGWPDVFIANGMVRDVQNADLGLYADRVLGGGSSRWAQFWASQPMQKEANMVFQNLGNLRFESVGPQWGLDRVGVSFGAATADFDNDGNMDLVVSNADAPLSVYRNRSRNNNRLRVRLKGSASNRYGVGATVRVRASGMEQTRVMTLTRGWLSGSDPTLHFGLDSLQTVESLAVNWPSGRSQRFANLQANRIYTITEPTEASIAPLAPKEIDSQLFTRSEGLGDIRQEEGTHYDDFAREPLLPRKLSQRAFCMEWADANGDGHKDLYLGGNKGVAGRLFWRTPEGKFVPSAQPALTADKNSEDTSAAFFDFDSDGDLDLYVVSGGVQDGMGHPDYRDRLYINDGQGNFTRAPEDTVPDFRDSGSHVAAADFDGDGRVDLFVGGGSVPGQYPFAANSHLLLNTPGKLVEAAPPSLRNVGIVTDAMWSDANGDGKLDLVVATEWGPVKLFLNVSGELQERTREAGLAMRTGWWNAIAGGDIDGDGDIDYVVGNQGLNTKYRATLERPELLFFGNLDGLGASHLLEAYFVGDFGYPHRGIDILSKSMPSLKEKFPSFDQFARAPIENVFSMDSLRRSSRREANTLESGVFMNDGQGRFEFRPLPALAQIAPARDVALADLNGDGYLDLLLAQNDFSPVGETGHVDGGVSLLLLGNGKGEFQPLWPNQSGIAIAGEAARVTVVDLDGDENPDIVFGVRAGRMKAFVRKDGR